MTRLSELRHRTSFRQPEPERSLGGGANEPGTIRNSAVYQRPIEGLFQGQAVTLLATGDIVGMSPAVQIVDENGHLDWVSAEDVTITDRAALPQSEQARNRLRNQQPSTERLTHA